MSIWPVADMGPSALMIGLIDAISGLGDTNRKRGLSLAVQATASDNQNASFSSSILARCLQKAAIARHRAEWSIKRNSCNQCAK